MSSASVSQCLAIVSPQTRPLEAQTVHVDCNFHQRCDPQRTISTHPPCRPYVRQSSSIVVQRVQSCAAPRHGRSCACPRCCYAMPTATRARSHSPHGACPSSRRRSTCGCCTAPCTRTTAGCSAACASVNPRALTHPREPAHQGWIQSEKNSVYTVLLSTALSDARNANRRAE